MQDKITIILNDLSQEWSRLEARRLRNLSLTPSQEFYREALTPLIPALVKIDEDYFDKFGETWEPPPN